MKTLLIVYSFHHHNTEKIAQAFADVLGAKIKTPQHTAPEALPAYDIVGFGSGIYSDQHHPSLLDLADNLLQITDKAYAPLREKLQAKGYMIAGEFMCPGWNTNKFLKLFGGINKGRSNAEDLQRARAFAQELNGLAKDIT